MDLLLSLYRIWVVVRIVYCCGTIPNKVHQFALSLGTQMLCWISLGVPTETTHQNWYFFFFFVDIRQ